MQIVIRELRARANGQISTQMLATETTCQLFRSVIVGSVGQGEIISILKNEQRAAAPSIRRSCYDLREGTASTHDVAQQNLPLV